jgi:hypothetical protein
MAHLYSHPSMNKLEICLPLASYHSLIYRFIAVYTNVSASGAEQNKQEWPNVCGSLTSARGMINGSHRFSGNLIKHSRKNEQFLKYWSKYRRNTLITPSFTTARNKHKLWKEQRC